MQINIDPLVDCVFKAILAEEGNKNLLMHFLNAVLALDGHAAIDHVDVLNPFNEREFQSAKLTVVDVKARDRRGHVFQIEIQRRLPPYTDKRMVYMWALLHAQQLKKGDDFEALRPTVAIWVLNPNASLNACCAPQWHVISELSSLS